MSKIIYEFKEKQKDFAQKCRNDLLNKPTECELLYKKYLKDNKIKFEFQKIIYNKEGSFYIVDFYIPVFKLIIEIDGGYHKTPEQDLKDRHRSFELRSMGYHLIRITNEEVKKKYS